MNQPTLLHIVKRYGPVGGMERYVWELTQTLANAGYSIQILCEEAAASPQNTDIQIHVLKKTVKKPRWLSMCQFSRQVSLWCKKNVQPDWIIHSHERSNVHHITTFHGPPFAEIRQKPWWKRASLRAQAWLYLEKRELLHNNPVVIANSQIIQNKLQQFYAGTPCVFGSIIPPGVHLITAEKKSHNKIHIGFIGKEWKRKGLKKALEIVTMLHTQLKNIHFIVAGPIPNEIEFLFKNFPASYELKGWIDATQVYPELDLLIHPASNEPYGMVVAEATAYGIPVIVSSESGVAMDMTLNSGQVFSVEDPSETWALACLSILKNPSSVKSIAKTWEQIAFLYDKEYQKIHGR